MAGFARVALGACAVSVPLAGSLQPMHVEHEVGRRVFLDALDALLAVAVGLTDEELLAASRCRGWTVGDVLVHVHLGLQEMLLGIVAPTTAEPDTDAAGYWRAELPTNDVDADRVAQIRFVRLLGAAYRRPSGLVAHLRPTAEGVASAAASLSPGALRFQGHVLRTGDFLATWAVELAIHHLDLGLELEVPAPPRVALSLVRATVQALAGGPLPVEWADDTVALLGAGRLTSTDPAAGRLPVLG